MAGLVKQFLLQASKDEQLREKIEALGKLNDNEISEDSKNETVKSFISLAKEHGYDISLEDLKEARKERSGDELEGVSGGIVDWIFWLFDLCMPPAD